MYGLKRNRHMILLTINVIFIPFTFMEECTQRMFRAYNQYRALAEVQRRRKAVRENVIFAVDM